MPGLHRYRVRTGGSQGFIIPREGTTANASHRAGAPALDICMSCGSTCAVLGHKLGDMPVCEELGKAAAAD